MTTANERSADYPIDPIFLERWSPRAFTGESISEKDLFTMLEAARWAASSGNVQPWRFIYAHRNTAHWEKFVGLLVPGNQVWAKNASALVILVSNSLVKRPGSDAEVLSPTHSFDTGTASGYFALQASLMGWHAHGMAGFDRERAFVELNVSKGYTVEFAYAVGRLGDPTKLPVALQAREHPSTRLPLKELAFEGLFQAASTAKA
ncbi:MAG: nitroreductase [Acidobacteriaceae bacterium]|nr:nitroreductase [Acidobacteriaceae bacterium]